MGVERNRRVPYKSTTGEAGTRSVTLVSMTEKQELSVVKWDTGRLACVYT